MIEKKDEKQENLSLVSESEGDIDKSNQCQDPNCRRKIKNYISMIILLIGLLLGSIFVDIAQFFAQQGVSPRVLKSVDIFPFEGKTWVAYQEPVVNLQVLTDSKCEKCDPTEPLKWLKRVIPTIIAKKVEFDSEEGKNLLEKFNIKNVPAFVFDENLTKTDVYQQAGQIFEKKDNNYLMKNEQVGISAGKYLETPEISEKDSQVGNKDSKVKVVLFSDFQCPYCKAFHESFRKAINDYKDKVLFVYKYLPLDFHPQAKNAAQAAACAQDQEKFWEMADKLYASQNDWGKTEGTSRFKTYASMLGLNAAKFNQCLDSSQFSDIISSDQKTAQDFGISGTPAFFVNDQFFSGVVSYDEMKKAIDEELGK